MINTCPLVGVPVPNYSFTYFYFDPFQLAKCQGVCYHFHVIAAAPFNQFCKGEMIDSDVD
jgi:hypothetical protein